MHKIESSLLDCFRKYTSKSNKYNKSKKANPTAECLFIAYSGGLDSSVLLFASKQLHNKKLIPKVRALHVNHGIASESYSWQAHCQLICDKYSIELSNKELNLLSSSQKASENLARNARYAFFESYLTQESLIAFAHHQDDQVETLLFRLFRGTGLSGAAAIPESRKLGDGKIIRPFLNISKDELLNYAEENKLKWIEDPSNSENGYSRNIIRNTILPLIKQSWPKVVDSLNSFTHIAREQNEILLEVASNDLLTVSSHNHISRQIDLTKFIKLSKVRQKNLLHYWIVNYSKNDYSRATNQEIEELLWQLENHSDGVGFECSNDSKLNVKLGNCRVRFYHNKLWLCEYSEPTKLEKTILWDDFLKPMDIFHNHKIMTNYTDGSINELSMKIPGNDEVVTLRPRVGGEKVKPQYRDKSCELKKIYQELNIPHWKREWLPIIYYNEQIACVPGVFVNKDLIAQPMDKAIEFSLNTNKKTNENKDKL